jgi:hypothetical protein
VVWLIIIGILEKLLSWSSLVGSSLVMIRKPLLSRWLVFCPVETLLFPSWGQFLSLL